MDFSDLIFSSTAGVDCFANNIIIDADDPAQIPEIQSEIHLRIQQRNKKKCLTLIEGLADDLDLEKLLRFMKKKFSTNGAILQSEEGTIIQLQGDHRASVKDFFSKYKVCERKEISIHG